MEVLSEPDDAKNDSVRVLIADDHPMYRHSVATTIIEHPRLQLVGEASTGAQVLAQIAARSVDVAVLDLRMPDLDAFAVFSALMYVDAPPRVLVLSAYCDGATVHRALEAGAAGFVCKDADEQEICAAIFAVFEGQTVIPARLQQGVFTRIRQLGADSRLSVREREVLTGVAAGQQLAEIGVQLSLSQSTVKTYLHRAYGKLGVSDRAAAVAEAYKRGLL